MLINEKQKMKIQFWMLMFTHFDIFNAMNES